MEDEKYYKSAIALLLVIPWAIALCFSVYSHFMYCGINPSKNPTVNGKVISWSKPVEYRGNYFAEINYEYFVNNKRYVSQMISCGSSTGDEESFEKYPVGKTITVYYRKERPELAFLEPKMGGEISMIMIGGIFITVLGLFVLYKNR